jgi:hypothetical protein
VKVGAKSNAGVDVERRTLPSPLSPSLALAPEAEVHVEKRGKEKTTETQGRGY